MIRSLGCIERYVAKTDRTTCSTKSCRDVAFLAQGPLCFVRRATLERVQAPNGLSTVSGLAGNRS